MQTISIERPHEVCLNKGRIPKRRNQGDFEFVFRIRDLNLVFTAIPIEYIRFTYCLPGIFASSVPWPPFVSLDWVADDWFILLFVSNTGQMIGSD